MNDAKTFDAEEGLEYAFCLMCPTVMPTKDDADDHLNQTYSESAGSGHVINVQNPTREEQVVKHVRSLMEKMVQDLSNEPDLQDHEVSYAIEHSGTLDLYWRAHLAEKHAASD